MSLFTFLLGGKQIIIEIDAHFLFRAKRRIKERRGEREKKGKTNMRPIHETDLFDAYMKHSRDMVYDVTGDIFVPNI